VDRSEEHERPLALLRKPAPGVEMQHQRSSGSAERPQVQRTRFGNAEVTEAPTDFGSHGAAIGGVQAMMAAGGNQAMVQLQGGGADGVHAAAAHGISSGGGALPFADKIQQSFGSHDISSVQAHTGPAADKATQAMGASAYATGNHVVLGSGAMDLHTAAHEAAHVVQQRGGVSLKDGVGQSGDKYEQHADAVADAVVAGKSAEGLLDGMAGGARSGAATQMRAVQRDGHAGTNREGNYEDRGNVGQSSYGERNSDGVGVGVSTENGGQVTADREWTIWEGTAPPVPIPGVPGLFLTVTPSVKATVGASFQGLVSGQSQVEFQGNVTGAVDVGLEFGAPPAASIYFRAGPQLQAQASLTFDNQGLQAAAATLSLDATARVGVQAGNGALDYNLVLARANILRVVGFQYTRGRGTTWGAIQPGQDVIDALRWAKRTYDRVAGMATDALNALGGGARRVGSAVSDAYSWLTGR
jgi:hypothetical protein